MKTYPSVQDAVAYLRERCPPELSMPGAAEGYEWLDYSDFLPESIEWFDFDRDFPCGRILPSQMTPFLYRGQTKRYDSCRPSIYRGFPIVKRPRDLDLKCRLRYILCEIQTCWFTIETRKHPAWKYAHEIGLQIHHWALAQHYGIATPWLDLTQSIDVAAFFATSEYHEGEWKPKTSGRGVLYRLDFSSIPQAWDYLQLVGLSTFPRPGEQKAWAVPINLNGDFEKLPYVETLDFTHTATGSDHFHGMFHGGKDLFPYDPAHDMAEAIRNSKTLPVNCVANGLRGLGCPMDRLEVHFGRVTKALKETWGYEVANEIPIGMNDEQVAALTSYWEAKGKEFLKDVGVRPVALLTKGGPWMPTVEAASLLGCTMDQCRRLIKDGKLEAIRAFRLGTRKPRLFVKRQSVQDMLKGIGKPNQASEVTARKLAEPQG